MRSEFALNLESILKSRDLPYSSNTGALTGRPTYYQHPMGPTYYPVVDRGVLKEVIMEALTELFAELLPRTEVESGVTQAQPFDGELGER